MVLTILKPNHFNTDIYNVQILNGFLFWMFGMWALSVFFLLASWFPQITLGDTNVFTTSFIIWPFQVLSITNLVQQVYQQPDEEKK